MDDEPKTIGDIPEGREYHLCNPTLLARITGVSVACIRRNGRVSLRYIDGKVEHDTTPMPTDRPMPCMVECVEHVQRQRVEIEG